MLSVSLLFFKVELTLKSLLLLLDIVSSSSSLTLFFQKWNFENLGIQWETLSYHNENIVENNPLCF